MSDENRVKTLWAASLYGASTRKGRVDLSEVDADGAVVWQRQVSIDEARDFAHHILEAAEAAETDELLVTWLTDKVGAGPLERVAAMLVDFRKLREQRKP
jgi:hypothetical protein